MTKGYISRKQMINIYDENYNFLSLGSSEKEIPKFLKKGERSKTPGVPIAQANIQALIHSLNNGGNWFVLILVTKKLTIPVITVAKRIDEITVPVVWLNNYKLRKNYIGLRSNFYSYLNKK